MELSVEIKNAINHVGKAILLKWFKENEVDIKVTKNIFDDIALAIEEERLTREILNKGISELEECGSKLIKLYQVEDLNAIDKRTILRRLHRVEGYVPVDNYSARVTPKESSTFNYFHWGDEIIKLKFSEKHYIFESDFETGQMVKKELPVYIVFIINVEDGLVQVRMDKAGEKHRHKNSTNKSSEAVFQNFYLTKLFELFPEITFTELNLGSTIREIISNREVPFQIHKGVATITGEAKLTHSWRNKTDIRDLPEYIVASETKEAADWLTEDLTGYWMANGSELQLTDDLYMRISRKNSELRVLRSCLEKELNYGVNKIREIQKGI